MKVSVRTLGGTRFEIEAMPEDTIADVKKNIETVRGAYPASRQMLIHQGAVMKDGTTLEENKVTESNFIVVMLNKAPQSSVPPVTTQISSVAASQAPAPAPAPATATPGPAPVVDSNPSVTAGSEANVYGQVASSLVAGNNLEGTIQQILDMGGGSWDRDTVARALGAAYNNPERAVEYLYSGIPISTETVATPRRAPGNGQSTASLAQPLQVAPPTTAPPAGPNVNPLNLFPQGVPNVGSIPAGWQSLDSLTNRNQFQALRAMIEANPQILQPMLQELGKRNPQLVRLIQENQADFLRLLNEPRQGGEGNDMMNQLIGGEIPQAIQVTAEEQEAMGRLEAMGFDRALVLEVFIACNKNEELAANYLLDHSHEFE